MNPTPAEISKQRPSAAEARSALVTSPAKAVVIVPHLNDSFCVLAPYNVYFLKPLTTRTAAAVDVDETNSSTHFGKVQVPYEGGATVPTALLHPGAACVAQYQVPGKHSLVALFGKGSTRHVVVNLRSYQVLHLRTANPCVACAFHPSCPRYVVALTSDTKESVVEIFDLLGQVASSACSDPLDCSSATGRATFSIVLPQADVSCLALVGEEGVVEGVAGETFVMDGVDLSAACVMVYATGSGALFCAPLPAVVFAERPPSSSPPVLDLRRITAVVTGPPPALGDRQQRIAALYCCWVDFNLLMVATVNTTLMLETFVVYRPSRYTGKGHRKHRKAKHKDPSTPTSDDFVVKPLDQCRMSADRGAEAHQVRITPCPSTELIELPFTAAPVGNGSTCGVFLVQWGQAAVEPNGSSLVALPHVDYRVHKGGNEPSSGQSSASTALVVHDGAQVAAVGPQRGNRRSRHKYATVPCRWVFGADDPLAAAGHFSGMTQVPYHEVTAVSLPISTCDGDIPPAPLVIAAPVTPRFVNSASCRATLCANYYLVVDTGKDCDLTVHDIGSLLATGFMAQYTNDGAAINWTAEPMFRDSRKVQRKCSDACSRLLQFQQSAPVGGRHGSDKPSKELKGVQSAVGAASQSVRRWFDHLQTTEKGQQERTRRLLERYETLLCRLELQRQEVAQKLVLLSREDAVMQDGITVLHAMNSKLAEVRRILSEMQPASS